MEASLLTTESLMIFALLFQYYGYRERLKHFGREDDVEQLNRTALRIAREVADDMEKLMAGNLSNTPMYDPDDRSMDQKISEMFQVGYLYKYESSAFIVC